MPFDQRSSRIMTLHLRSHIRGFLKIFSQDCTGQLNSWHEATSWGQDTTATTARSIQSLFQSNNLISHSLAKCLNTNACIWILFPVRRMHCSWKSSDGVRATPYICCFFVNPAILIPSRLDWLLADPPNLPILCLGGAKGTAHRC